MDNTIKHVAVIPDGNRRWARQRHLPVIEGHRRGSKVIEKLINHARKLDIRIMTFWFFSTENWKRSSEEVEGLMSLFEQQLVAHTDQAIKDKSRIIHIGRKDRLRESLRKKIEDAEARTREFSDYFIVFAIDYGGRDEVLRAINRIMRDTSNVEPISEEDISKNLDTKDLPYPEPDLIIRTSGEYRTSGFMIWQSAYSEYIFLEKYFPDMAEKDLDDAIAEFHSRARRYGK